MLFLRCIHQQVQKGSHAIPRRPTQYYVFRRCIVRPRANDYMTCLQNKKMKSVSSSVLEFPPQCPAQSYDIPRNPSWPFRILDEYTHGLLWACGEDPRSPMISQPCTFLSFPVHALDLILLHKANIRQFLRESKYLEGLQRRAIILLCKEL